MMTVVESTRNAERTRHAVLVAASRVVAERGTAATLRDIAEAAQVSKSGLLHHFGSRDSLMREVAADLLERFHEAVMAHLDLSENRPGKTLRAYVRALCSDEQVVRDYNAFAGIWTALIEVPGVAEVFERDNDRWRADLAQDGLDPDRILIVRSAAEGLAVASSYDSNVRDHGIARALPILLAMTDDDSSMATS